ncbi:putative multi antimicrobial extrusion protein [Helianthus anomalus]
MCLLICKLGRKINKKCFVGRGNAKAAKFSIKVLLGTSIAIGLFFFVLCLIFGRKIAYLFTNDERVVDTVSDLSLLLSFSVLLNSIHPVLSGVAIGAGMQSTVAIVNLGIWMGMIGGVVTETIALIYMA